MGNAGFISSTVVWGFGLHVQGVACRLDDGDDDEDDDVEDDDDDDQHHCTLMMTMMPRRISI